jgi:2-keto-4-pentenoate hydratase/2-oxohepta-3-ene-1,7-dioic acid hydratase in catechol pathway
VKIARVDRKHTTQYAIVEGDALFSVDGDIFGRFNIGKGLGDLDEVKLLPPVRPKIVVGIGSNYPSQLDNHSVAGKLEVFLKPASSVVGHMNSIVYPEIANDVGCGGELAIVIKREARYITPDKAIDYILGYTCANDVTAFDIADKDTFVTRAKSFYTFCPLGPWIVTDIDVNKLNIESRLNGVQMQSASTSDMIYDTSKIISFVSSFMSLEPGDVIITGSPGSSEFRVHVGDTIEVEIEGIGILRNTVGAPQKEASYYD